MVTKLQLMSLALNNSLRDPALKLSEEQIATICSRVEGVINEVVDITLLKSYEGEPVFVLRAQDEAARKTVLGWLGRNPDLPDPKKHAACEVVKAMEAWPARKAD